MDLDKRMKEAGMMTISEMKKTLLNNPFLANADVVDMSSFRDWLNMRFDEMSKIQAKMILDKKEDDEMFEWVLSHAAVFREVLANFEKVMLNYQKTDKAVH